MKREHESSTPSVAHSVMERWNRSICLAIPRLTSHHWIRRERGFEVSKFIAEMQMRAATMGECLWITDNGWLITVTYAPMMCGG